MVFWEVLQYVEAVMLKLESSKSCGSSSENETGEEGQAWTCRVQIIVTFRL